MTSDEKRDTPWWDRKGRARAERVRRNLTETVAHDRRIEARRQAERIDGAA